MKLVGGLGFGRVCPFLSSIGSKKDFILFSFETRSDAKAHNNLVSEIGVICDTEKLEAKLEAFME